MTPEERAEMRALADAATPGEWRAQSDRNDQPNIYGETDDQWIAILPHQCVRSIEIQAVANAAFIVAARTAVPALLDEVSRLVALSLKARCSWCGVLVENNAETMLDHALACADRIDAAEAMLRHAATALVPLEAENARLREAQERPLPIALACPRCHQQHVDEGEWAIRSHKRHACVPGPFGGGCGAIWKPADTPTVGIMRPFGIDDMLHTPFKDAIDHGEWKK